VIFISGRGETGKHLLLIFLAFLFATWGIGRIRQDLKMNIKIDLWKTLKTGSTFLILAFSLIITSQYYVETKNTRLENTLPKFQIKALSDTLTSKFLASFNPDFENLSQDGITVDEFILEAQKKKLAENLKEEDAKAKLLESSQTFLLEKGRSEMSELAGKKLSGQEKMADVFAAAVNNKINDFVAPNFSGNSHSSAWRLIVALLLFLTVVSLGSFLGIFLIPLTKLIFFVLKKIGLIEIKKIQKEVEEIA
jgi:energy-coupling factor transporter transmembrane protein EcfT